MATRITQKDLERIVLRINRALNRPETPYGKDENGKFKANLGNFHISGAYGGVALEEIQTDGGGVRRVSTDGYGTKGSYTLGAPLSLLALNLSTNRGKTDTLKNRLLVRFYNKKRTSNLQKAQCEMYVTGYYTTLLHSFLPQSRTFEWLVGFVTPKPVFRRSKRKQKVVRKNR